MPTWARSSDGQRDYIHQSQIFNGIFQFRKSYHYSCASHPGSPTACASSRLNENSSASPRSPNGSRGTTLGPCVLYRNHIPQHRLIAQCWLCIVLQNEPISFSLEQMRRTQRASGKGGVELPCLLQPHLNRSESGACDASHSQTIPPPAFHLRSGRNKCPPQGDRCREEKDFPPSLGKVFLKSLNGIALHHNAK